jgi:DNA-binding transcriptional LysR family regulator
MDPLRNIALFVAVAPLVAVARHGGFRAAADQLGLRNSTVSRRIAEMEAGLGLRLFTRTTRRVELTEHGRLLFTRCQALIDEAEAAQVELSQLATVPLGMIRASLPVDFAAGRIAGIVADFLALHPKVRFA